MHVESTLVCISATTQAPAAADSLAPVPACVRKRTDRSFGAGTLMTAPDLSAFVTTRRLARSIHQRRPAVPSRSYFMINRLMAPHARSRLSVVVLLLAATAAASAQTAPTAIPSNARAA